MISTGCTARALTSLSAAKVSKPETRNLWPVCLQQMYFACSQRPQNTPHARACIQVLHISLGVALRERTRTPTYVKQGYMRMAVTRCYNEGGCVGAWVRGCVGVWVWV